MSTFTSSMCVGCDAIGRMYCEVCLHIHKENMLNPEYKLAHEMAIQKEIDDIVKRYEEAYLEPRVEEPEPEFSEEELELARQKLLEIGRRVKQQLQNQDGDRLVDEDDLSFNEL
jgi:hypothetical protein